MTRLITTVEALPRAGRVVTLGSGGLDSAYLARHAATADLDLVVLFVGVGGEGPEAARAVCTRYGIPLVEVDAQASFADEYVAPSLRAAALHQGVYPPSSSLSRPLMAAVAVEVAAQQGAATILHTAEAHQNSFARLNNALRALAPHLSIGNPFLESHIPRETKRAALAADGIELLPSINSIDTNLLCRVIENGTLDISESEVPESIFTWTTHERTVPSTIELGFEHGLPVSLNGATMPLATLLATLNPLAGAYGIGRFSGFEQTPWGAKNREIRECPAEAVIRSAAVHLRQVVLDDDELAFLANASAEWMRRIIAGRWFTPLSTVLTDAIAALSRPVSGTVVVRLAPGGAFVSAVRPRQSLALDQHPVDLSAPLSYERLLLAAVPYPTNSTTT